MSQQRGGFRVDATTMGLTASKPPHATTRGMQQQQEQQQQQQQQEKDKDKDKEMEQQESKNVSHSQCKPGLEPLPTAHFAGQVQKLAEISGDGAKMNFDMNQMFLKRLESIDEQSAGDSMESLRLVTLQDWIDHLLYVNYMIFDNMTSLEMEAYKKIMDCFQSSRGEQQQALVENRQLRKDICAITKFVQEAYHYNNWNTNDLCLETMKVNQFLRIEDCKCPEAESEKVAKNIKSLVNEVAAKHDEVCHLKSQLATMDEYVQTAGQKIILKDKCIEQLNQQIEELQSSATKMTKDSSTATLQEKCAGTSDLDLVNVDTSSCLFEGLNDWYQQESELFSTFNIELAEFIELVNKQDFPAVERRRNLLSCYVDKMKSDRSQAERNLENLRSQLRNLECSPTQLDEPIANSTKILEDECDIQLVETLRRRLKSLNDCNKELNTKYQTVEAQYKAQLLELTYTHKAEQSINQKNCLALKQIADLLSKLRCSDLSYKEIYTEESSDNPFCNAIMEMYDKLSELEKSTDKEELIQNTSDSDTKTTQSSR